MKRTINTAMILVLIAYTGRCQLLTAYDTLALKIPDQSTYSTSAISEYTRTHFSSDSDRLRALFVWVANNISYDVQKLRALKKPAEKASTDDILKARKGICEDYSELLVELCTQCNIRSIFVPGYTKRPDGAISDLSHAWVAAQVNNKWYLFDPTWAAGPVVNDHFTKTFSNRYYKVLPEEMIKDHMPFDPVYQFLNYLVKYDEFNAGITRINTTKSFFNYADTMNRDRLLAEIDQTRNIAMRVQNNGVRTWKVEEWLQFLNRKQQDIIKNQQANNSKNGYDRAVIQYNLASALFNRYIQNKRTRFASIKEDREIQQMIDSVLLYINTAKSMLAPVVADSEENRQVLFRINQSLMEFKGHVDTENEFLKKYLLTDKSLRKM